MITKSFKHKIKFTTKISSICTNISLFNSNNHNEGNKSNSFSNFFHTNSTIKFHSKNLNAFIKINKSFFSSEIKIIRPEQAKKKVRRDKEFIIERLKSNLIDVVRDRYDILGTHSGINSLFDVSSPYDIVLMLNNTKHLKIYGANNIFYNNSKYVLFETDDILNLNLLLAKDLFFSKAELFTLYSKILDDLELGNLYTEKELLDYVDYSYIQTSTLNDVLDFLVNTVECYQEETKAE